MVSSGGERAQPNLLDQGILPSSIHLCSKPMTKPDHGNDDNDEYLTKISDIKTEYREMWVHAFPKMTKEKSM